MTQRGQSIYLHVIFRSLIHINRACTGSAKRCMSLHPAVFSSRVHRPPVSLRRDTFLSVLATALSWSSRAPLCSPACCPLVSVSDQPKTNQKNTPETTVSATPSEAAPSNSVQQMFRTCHGRARTLPPPIHFPSPVATLANHLAHSLPQFAQSDPASLPFSLSAPKESQTTVHISHNSTNILRLPSLFPADGCLGYFFTGAKTRSVMVKDKVTRKMEREVHLRCCTQDERFRGNVQLV